MNVQGLEVGEDVIGILVCALARDGAFDNGVAILFDLVPPVAVLLAWVCEESVGPRRLGNDRRGGVNGLRDRCFGNCGGHDEKSSRKQISDCFVLRVLQIDVDCVAV